MMKKRFLAVLICLCMVVSMWPSAVFAQDEDAAQTSSSVGDEIEPVCTCETLCTEGAVNAACPVCSAAGADLAACKGEAPADPVCTCETLCTEGAVDASCPVCSTEGADLSACKGEAPAPPSTEPLRAPKADGSTIYVSDLELTGSASNPVYAKCGTTAIYKLTLGGNENDYNVKWDGSTLTLWNATLGANVNSNAIRFEGNTPLTIALRGENYISPNSKGIFVEGDLTIQEAENGASLLIMNTPPYSIHAVGTLTMESGSLSTSGLIFTDDDFIVNGGSLTVSNDGCYAQMNFIINDGEIHIDGTPGPGGGVPGSAPTMNGNGIRVDEGDFTVHGGQVEIRGLYGILTEHGDAIFDGGKVDIITNQYGGIATSSMTISGGELTITAPEDAFAFTRFDTKIEILPKNGKEIVVEKGTSASDAVAMEDSPFVVDASFTPASSTSLRYFHSKEKDAPVLYLGGVGFYSGDAEYAITNSNGTVTTEGASSDNYTIWWDGTNKLEFLDATIAGSHTYRSSEAALYTELQSLEIALQGTNTIISPDTTDRESCGIYSKGECAITGDGSLAITGGEISEAAPSASVTSIGIFLESSLSITDATVNVSGGDVEGSGRMSNGIISMGTVTITGSTVTAVGGKADQSMGIGAMEGLTVNDGTVLTATGGEGYWSSGIMSQGNVVIHGGSTTATCEGNGFGVDAEDLQIYGGEVTAINNNGKATRSDVHIFPDADAAILAEVGENKDSASQVEGSPFSASQSMPQGGYQVTVSDSYFHSETCKATVITKQPKDISTVVGDGAVFTIQATGTKPTYQWQQSTDGGQHWTNVDGATQSSFVVMDVTEDMDGTQYRCVVTGYGGTVESKIVKLTVNQKIVILTPPADVTVTEDQSASFQVEATGTNVTYQWQQSADDGKTWQDIADETDATYTIAKTAMGMNGTQYRCVVTGGGGTVESDAAALTVHQKTIITTQPTSLTVTRGQNASFQVEATGDNVTYQWQQSTDGGKTWTDIKDATGATYTVASTTTAMDGTQYRCVVTGAGGRVEGNAATLTVKEEQALVLSAAAAEEQVVLSWEKPKDRNVIGYELYVTPEGESEPATPIVIQDGEAVSYTVKQLQDGSPLENDKAYVFRLVALYAEGSETGKIQSNEVKGIPNPLYQLTVVDGGAGATVSGRYAAKNEITIQAGTKDNSAFLGWTSPDGVIFADASSPVTTMTMPAADVTVTANWHTHSWSTVWSSDGTSHWYACSGCNEKRDQAAHTFVWVIDKAATATQAGSKHEECTVCSYAKAKVEIPATGTGENSSQNSTSDGTQAITNPPSGSTPSGSAVIPQTGDDSHVILWMVLLLVSGAGLCTTAVYRRKQRGKKQDQ